MDQATIKNHVTILEEELVRALGCTEPIAIAYAASLASAALRTVPERLSVACSGNIIKNVKSVTVPNSGGMHGIEAAAILGAVGGNPLRALEVLNDVDEKDIELTHELLAQGACSVGLVEDAPNLFVRVVVTAGGHEAVACIEDRHTNVRELTRDGQAVCVAGIHGPRSGHASSEGDDDGEALRSSLTLESIWEFAHEVDIELIRELVERQIEDNEAISREGLSGSWGAKVGRTLLATRPNDISTKARALAAAGSDARMSGCAMPVVICCGSGNQGITCSMPVLAYARELGCDRERLIRAVALSNLTAVHVKHFIGELSAFCGAVSAAAGAGAAICWLRGGSFDQFGATIVNTLGNVGGIVCDGAKPSCAAKVSAAVDAAILACDMALADDGFLPGEGLVGDSAEQTIRSMGYVGRVGMHPTDIEILNIMIGKTDVMRDC